MKMYIPPSLLLLLLPSSTIVLATHFTLPPSPAITSAPIQTATPSEAVPTISTIPATFIAPSQTHTYAHIWDPIVSEASYLLNELNEHLHPDLRKRQVAAGATAVVPTTIPVQMPSVTVYQMYGVGAVLTYTQTFPLDPDPWPSPSAGTIGLGTIQGTVGITKTISKRSDLPEPTGPNGRALRIRGRTVQ